MTDAINSEFVCVCMCLPSFSISNPFFPIHFIFKYHTQHHVAPFDVFFFGCDRRGNWRISCVIHIQRVAFFARIICHYRLVASVGVFLLLEPASCQFFEYSSTRLAGNREREEGNDMNLFTSLRSLRHRLLRDRAEKRDMKFHTSRGNRLSETGNHFRRI